MSTEVRKECVCGRGWREREREGVSETESGG